MFIVGVCVCNTGFIGFDCSVTSSAAPTELTIPNKGLCSTKTRLCQKTNIFSIFYSAVKVSVQVLMGSCSGRVKPKTITLVFLLLC